MDPYLTLGIQRGCTRQEAKDAFRARALHVHPDRGGDEKAFIQLDTAYNLILRELDLVPSNTTGSPARAPGTSPPPHSFYLGTLSLLERINAPSIPALPVKKLLNILIVDPVASRYVQLLLFESVRRPSSHRTDWL